MEYNNENSVGSNKSTVEKRALTLQFASQLRPPSQIPTPGKLFEMSAAATNARSTMLPPPNNDKKRKTLAERAGEPSRPTPAPPSSRPVNAHVRATSLAGVARETSFSSSVSSRPSSVASTRNTSGSSYSSSVGPGSRPPSSHYYRPQSALSHPRIQRPVSSLNRPATSLEAHEEEPGTARILGKRKGRTPFPLNPQDCPPTIRPPRMRGSRDTQKVHSSEWESNPFRTLSFREASLSKAFSGLSLHGEASQSAPTAHLEAGPASAHRTPASKAGAPPTPTLIPRLAPRAVLPVEPQSPSKTPKKTPKPLPQFLTRSSNEVIAWDTDSRLEEVENMCSEFREKMDGATTESKSLREMMGIYKIRSMNTQDYTAPSADKT